MSNKTELADIRSILDASGLKGYGKCDVLDYKDRKFAEEHHFDGNMTKSRPYRCQPERTVQLRFLRRDIGIIERGGTASLRSRTCVKRNVAFGARFKGLSLYFYIKMGN